MFGIIKRINRGTRIDPESYFDPTTHIATEENFIKFLQSGTYDNKFIGYGVQLSNIEDYNNGIQIIADVNHDNENTEQTNCYDLISQDCFHQSPFSNIDKNQRTSAARDYLNNTFYNGFNSDFKNHIINLKYNSSGTQYTDDYIILPSYKEVNGGTSIYQENEGIAYPIFTDSTSRIKKNNSSTFNYQQTRSRDQKSNSNVQYIISNGNLDRSSYYYYNNLCIAPLIRVS